MMKRFENIKGKRIFERGQTRRKGQDNICKGEFTLCFGDQRGEGTKGWKKRKGKPREDQKVAQ